MGAALAKRGRPTEFDDRIAGAVLALLEAGKTEQQISEAIGISTRTLSRWKLAHQDFRLAVKAAKSISDDMVEEALFDSALGGNVTAMIFWLKNRQPDRWRDVHRVEHNVRVELPTLQEARQILDADYAVLPAGEIKVEPLEGEAKPK